jgi:hypothetical protein
MAKHRIQDSVFAGVDVTLGEYFLIVQHENGGERDQITLDAKQAGELADLLFAWVHSAVIPIEWNKP